MTGNKVQLDFRESVEQQVQKAPAGVGDDFRDLVKKVKDMTLEEVMADKGLSFEKDLSRKKEKIWTLRLNRNWRAICWLHTGPVIQILAVLDHTKTHARHR